MRTILILLLFNFKSYGQDYLVFKTNNEVGVVSYNVQQSADKNTWVNISTIQPLKKDSNTYTYPLSVADNYRIAANMKSNIYYTAILYYAPQSPNSVTISKTKISTSWWTDKLTWTTTNENNVAYYLIEYTSGASWKQLVNIVDKGNGNYSYSNSRGWFSKKPNYRLTPIFKDGSSGTIIYF
ncbi:MAG TPA: hypothetical protein VN698_15045 [Bacteroidia bacterium]|nr:hypothetical protein [Bacteroidia bacterium]